MSKGSGRRPAAKPGAYESEYERIFKREPETLQEGPPGTPISPEDVPEERVRASLKSLDDWEWLTGTGRYAQ